MGRCWRCGNVRKSWSNWKLSHANEEWRRYRFVSRFYLFQALFFKEVGDCWLYCLSLWKNQTFISFLCVCLKIGKKDCHFQRKKWGPQKLPVARGEKLPEGGSRRRRHRECKTKKKQLDLVKRFVLIVLMEKQTSKRGSEKRDGQRWRSWWNADVSRENYDSSSLAERKKEKKLKKNKTSGHSCRWSSCHVVPFSVYSPTPWEHTHKPTNYISNGFSCVSLYYVI